MIRRVSILSVICLAAVIILHTVADAKRISLKVDTKAMQGQQTLTRALTPDSANVIRGEQAKGAVSFYGYDKPFSSSKESVFVTNALATDTLAAVGVLIEYSTMSGKLLHKRNVTFEQEVAPGESARLLFDTWDATRTFYYFRTPPARKQNLTPYQVKILPLEIIIKQ